VESMKAGTASMVCYERDEWRFVYDCFWACQRDKRRFLSMEASHLQYAVEDCDRSYAAEALEFNVSVNDRFEFLL
jgi:hypothetical protein